MSSWTAPSPSGLSGSKTGRPELSQELEVCLFMTFTPFFLLHFFFISPTMLLVVVLLLLLLSNSIGEQACQQAGEHRPYSYIRVYFLTSTNSLSCLIYLAGQKGNAYYQANGTAIGEGSWYVVLMMMCLLFRL